MATALSFRTGPVRRKTALSRTWLLPAARARSRPAQPAAPIASRNTTSCCALKRSYAPAQNFLAARQSLESAVVHSRWHKTTDAHTHASKTSPPDYPRWLGTQSNVGRQRDRPGEEAC